MYANNLAFFSPSSAVMGTSLCEIEQERPGEPNLQNL